MGAPSLPPPAAAPQRRSHHKLNIPLSFFAVILFIFYIQFSLLPRFLDQPSSAQLKLSQAHIDRLNAGLEKCAAFNTPPIEYGLPDASRSNPRYNSKSGQKETIVLKNVTLFEGEKILSGFVDVKFSKGVFEEISESTKNTFAGQDATVMDLAGQFVTPGMVDMHSHHLVMAWPSLDASDDTNEVNREVFGALTPQLRSLDGMKAYDPATRLIASGGITTSLVLPGSANIMGGEAFPVKNFMKSGENGEYVVEEMLLEHGISKADRRRYMKMACGENPREVYQHTRMGNAYLFRKQMARAKDLMEKQDEWCLSAAVAKESGDEFAISQLVATESHGLPEDLELDSSIAMLRGQVNINTHCYEPEDMEDMLLHSKEFGFRIAAFHHALEAWQVPEMIKDSGYNTTIATFAEFGLYKQEAYGANLWAGSILADHHVPLAYKSDHGEQETSAKWLMYQAAVGHSFHLPEELALQSVTSVPAKSIDQSHRVGYVRPGYDADIVVWNAHPLSLGATPLQVYIDGKATLDPEKVAETLPKTNAASMQLQEKPKIHTKLEPQIREELCATVQDPSASVVITGIKRSFFDNDESSTEASEDRMMVINNGKITCLDTEENCDWPADAKRVIKLENGYVLPGLTVLSSTLGLNEIQAEDSTGDGGVSSKVDVPNPDNVVYAKDGVHLDGRAFKRARYGGVTRAITAPIGSSFLKGVSTAIVTSGNKTLLNGGIYQDDVALHFTVGQDAKSTESISTVSGSIETLRKILNSNIDKDNIYGLAANGSIPLAVHVHNQYDIQRLIQLKNSTSINLIIIGGAEAHIIASELASAKIPVILAPVRAAPSSFEQLDTLPGPPLSKSSVAVLYEAGVELGLAFASMADSYIHGHLVEASWARKYTEEMSEREAVDMVSRNMERIFGIKGGEGDVVVWEGNPLELGATVAVTVEGEGGGVVQCWPDVE